MKMESKSGVGLIISRTHQRRLLGSFEKRKHRVEKREYSKGRAKLVSNRETHQLWLGPTNKLAWERTGVGRREKTL